ncbi:hypothetical protein K5X82_00120 [Halosquirtibacter xylanolyticus]|uniref:hypothetical protein n=1 Tax=Halosquirtibacter xylanolyticus TaxID=3374599 RepID=UPI00374A5EA4|nr:hypothetical protein K5X82_00120 [Prolixibacteraceae bacterium]
MTKSIVITLLLISCNLFAQVNLKNAHYELNINSGGQISQLITHGSNKSDTVTFQKGEWAGPQWYGKWDNKDHQIKLKATDQPNRFEQTVDDIHFQLEYHLETKGVRVRATLKNVGFTTIQPSKIGLHLGINTYMEKFPQWLHKFFPTMLRCEKTHLWGYAMAPDGRALCIASPNPIASWSNDFTKSWGEPDYKWFGHRINTMNLDVINPLPLPKRHPQDQYQLARGEIKKWDIYLSLVHNISEIEPKLSELTGAPFFHISETTNEADKPITFTLVGQHDSKVMVTAPNGDIFNIEANTTGEYTLDSHQQVGLYKLQAMYNDKISEAYVTFKKPWEWYLNQARQASFKYPARATTHCETWYGMYTMFLAEKYFPNPDLKERAIQQFDQIYSQLYDIKDPKPIKIAHRIQNTSSMIGVLVDKYQITKDIYDLERARDLADWIMKHAQAKDGSYRAGSTHYTSVIYPAKSIMELFIVEKELGKKDANWKKAYNRHFKSVKRAMDELVLSDGDIDTEGQLTYEDGMVSCSALQLAEFALLQSSTKEREKYKKAALSYIDGHKALTQLIIPDSRQRGGTMRFWESQYDVYIQPNIFNSPHGWTSWRTYATFYLYQLTGDTKWLVQTFNALGSAMQMIDTNTGKLRWAFTPSPYVEVIQTSQPHKDVDPTKYNPGHYHPRKYPHRKYVIGEQYIDMISDWIRANSQDNDVHEHFKCMEEVAMSNAFIAQTETGEFISYNCNISVSDDQININIPSKFITKLHINLNDKKKLQIRYQGKELQKKINSMKWIILE